MCSRQREGRWQAARWTWVLVGIAVVFGWSAIHAAKLMPEDLQLGRGELGHEHPKGYTLASTARIERDSATGADQLWITYRAANGSKGEATLDWCSAGYRFRFVKPGTVERQHIHFPYDGIWRYMNWVAPLDCGMVPGESGAVIETDTGSDPVANAPAHVPTSRVVLFHAKHVPATPLRWILKVVYDKESAGLEFTSTAERAGEEFKYTYVMRNGLKQAVFVQWASLSDSKSPSGLIIEIPPGGARDGSWVSRTPPILVNDVVAFNSQGLGKLPREKLRSLGVDPDRTARRKNLRELRSTENEFILVPALNSQDRSGS